MPNPRSRKSLKSQDSNRWQRAYELTLSKQFRQFERGMKGCFMTQTCNVVNVDVVETSPTIDEPEDHQRPAGTSVLSI